jgi:hypothetical protein
LSGLSASSYIRRLVIRQVSEVIDDANFTHDVFGIRKYLNRETGELTMCFVPRYTAAAEEVKQ